MVHAPEIITCSSETVRCSECLFWMEHLADVIFLKHLFVYKSDPDAVPDTLQAVLLGYSISQPGGTASYGVIPASESEGISGISGERPIFSSEVFDRLLAKAPEQGSRQQRVSSRTKIFLDFISLPLNLNG